MKSKLKAIGWCGHETSHMPEKIQLKVTRKFISGLVNVLKSVGRKDWW